MTVAEPPEGAATIQSQPAGIDWPGVCSAEFTEGTEVYLTVSTSPGWDFQGWSGACAGGSDFCSVMMSTPLQVAASFENRLQAPTSSFCRGRGLLSHLRDHAGRESVLLGMELGRSVGEQVFL